jgi:hypothetical protein
VFNFIALRGNNVVSDEADSGDGDNVSIGLFSCWAEFVVLDGDDVAFVWPNPMFFGHSDNNVEQPAVIYKSLFGSDRHFSCYFDFIRLAVLV